MDLQKLVLRRMVQDAKWREAHVKRVRNQRVTYRDFLQAFDRPRVGRDVHQIEIMPCVHAEPDSTREMRRLAPGAGTRFLSVYAETSVPARREWYRRFGHPVAEEGAEYLVTEGGLRSEHFSEARLRDLVGDCTIRPLAGIAWAVTF